MLELVRREIKFDGPVCLIEAKDLFVRLSCKCGWAGDVHELHAPISKKAENEKP